MRNRNTVPSICQHCQKTYLAKKDGKGMFCSRFCSNQRFKDPEEVHRAKTVDRTRRWRLANPGRRNLAERNNYAKHPEVYRKRSKKYEQDHPEIKRAACSRRSARKRGAIINDFTAPQWAEMKIAYRHRCAYCHRKMKRLEQDHITPLSKGGAHTRANIVPACRSCNARKNAGPVLSPVQPLLL